MIMYCPCLFHAGFGHGQLLTAPDTLNYSYAHKPALETEAIARTATL